LTNDNAKLPIMTVKDWLLQCWPTIVSRDVLGRRRWGEKIEYE